MGIAAPTVNGGAKGRLAAPAAGLGGGMMNRAFHQPVLRQEVLEHLAIGPEGLWVDATVGEGGHALAILEASAGGRVLGIDRDPRGLAQAAQRLRSYGDRFIPVQGSYAQMVELAKAQGIAQADGVLLDLGISSRQVDTPGYGLSFQRDEPLDMRFDPAGQTATAAHIVNTYGEDELRQLLFQYGEEPQARAIARALVRRRPIYTTGELAKLVAAVTGPRRGRRIHPATRTFQALRLAVNEELAHLEAGLKAAIGLLAPGGRLVVISYHSLEDRLVKTTLAREAARCVCPPGLPVCVCGHQPTLRLVSRRAIRPTAEEVRDNPRSRSARLRAAQRLAGPNGPQ
ncbi:MAG TPA: 16S rRNA (cytosine(1402)-N(4))-methyltransferase RsmH [Dehalococcoidia bacterium]|nr:16S rRNA (cytosine(1402)-N(4))-methyltransferase RsmH [Dehalococcoidia bacterium]